MMNELPDKDELIRLRRDESATGFDQPWAARTFAIVVKLFNQKHYAWPEWIDYFSAEIRAPGHYKLPYADDAEPLAGDAERIDANYSQLWLSATERLLADKGLVSKEELDARVAELAGAQDSEAGPGPDAEPKFTAGDRVTVRDMEPVGSAHLSLEVRTKTGTIERDLGRFAFAGGGQQHMYSVRFTAREIQGADASERDKLYFNLWESYLDPT